MSIYYNKYIKYKSKYIKLKDIDHIHNSSNIFNLQGSGEKEICNNLSIRQIQAIKEADLYNFINDIKENTNLETKLNINTQDEIYEIYYDERNGVNILSKNNNIVLNCINDEKCNITFKNKKNGSNEYHLIFNDESHLFFNKENEINVYKLKNIICDVLVIMNLYNNNSINARGIYMLINIFIKYNNNNEWMNDLENIWMQKTLDTMGLNVCSESLADKITIKLNYNKTKILEVRLNDSLQSFNIIKTELYEKDGKWYNIIRELMDFTIKKYCFKTRKTRNIQYLKYEIIYHEVILDLYPDYVLNHIIDLHNHYNKHNQINELFGYFINKIYNINDNFKCIGVDAGGITQQFYITLLKRLFDNGDERILKYENDIKYPYLDILSKIEKIDDIEKLYNLLKNIGILLDYIFRYNTNQENILHQRFILAHVIPNKFFTLFKEKYISFDHTKNDISPIYLLEICLDYHKCTISFLLNNYEYYINNKNDLLKKIFELFNKFNNNPQQKLNSYKSIYYFVNLLTYLNDIIENKNINDDDELKKELKKDDNLKQFIIYFISKNKISEDNFYTIMQVYNSTQDTTNSSNTDHPEIKDYETFIKFIYELEDFFYLKYHKYLDTVKKIYNGFNSDIKEAIEDPSNDVGLIIQGTLFSKLNWDNIIKTNITEESIGKDKWILLNERINWLKTKLIEYSQNQTPDELKWLTQFVFFITSSESLRENSHITIIPSSNELFKSHTCFNQLEIPISPMSYEKFHEILSNVIISAGSEFTDA